MSGGRPPAISDEELLQVAENLSNPVFSTSELAEHSPIGRQGAYQRLVDFKERGLVDSKKIGSSSAYWITDEGKAFTRSGAEE